MSVVLTSVVLKEIAPPVELTEVTVWSSGEVVPVEFVKLRLKLLETGIAPVVAAAEAGDMTGGKTLLLVLLVSVASVVVTVGAAVTTVVTLPLPILLVSITPDVVTVGTEVTTVVIPPIPSDVVKGGSTPAEVVTRGPEELRLEMLVEFSGMGGLLQHWGLGQSCAAVSRTCFQSGCEMG